MTAFPWRWLASQVVYRAFWITGVFVALALASFILDRDGAVYVWAFINKWAGTEYTADTGMTWITWPARYGGYALTAAVIYGSWLRFKRWGERLRKLIMGEKPQNSDEIEVV